MYSWKPLNFIFSQLFAFCLKPLHSVPHNCGKSGAVYQLLNKTVLAFLSSSSINPTVFWIEYVINAIKTAVHLHEHD
jgi:hypothetical protein